MFTAALFTIAKMWKKHKCPSIDEWIKMWHVCILCVCVFSPSLCDPWTVAHQVCLSMEFSRQEYQSGLLFHPLGHLPDLGIKLRSLASPALALRFFTTAPPEMEYYSAKKKRNLATCDNMEGITQSEIRERQVKKKKTSTVCLNSRYTNNVCYLYVESKKKNK